MLFDLLSVVALVSVATYMYICGNFGITRSAAFAPAIMAVVDGITCGDLLFSEHPILKFIVLAFRLSALLVCFTIVREDRIMAKKRSAKRRSYRVSYALQTGAIRPIKPEYFTDKSVECA